MATPTSLPIAFKVLTVNVHKGFTTFNRRFMLHELREAVRGVAADLGLEGNLPKPAED